MIICGLKLTHDGTVALIEDGRLHFSVEMEKIANNPRFTGIEETTLVQEVLKTEGVDIGDIDLFAVDGWGGTNKDALAIQPRLEIGDGHNWLAAKNNGADFKMGVAPYREETLEHDILEEWSFDGLACGDHRLAYKSYLHAAGHVAGAYCTSPFARAGESAYVLVWDGGMYPRLYYVDAAAKKIENLGPIFLLIGNIYTIFSQHFGPFKVKGEFAKDNLSVAGKVMAYIALGQAREEMFPLFDEIYATYYDHPMGFANIFASQFKKRVQGRGFSDEDILATFHVYLERMLIAKLEKKIKRFPRPGRNFCMAGGCGLNIKWNSALRDAGLFNGVYTPPFPNDSGSGIGAACCAMVNHTGNLALEWSVYGGPKPAANGPVSGWSGRECDLEAFAQWLHSSGEPAILLDGRAELGPRALGNRSIVAAATSPKMKDILNRIKQREDYRPVSPICLEDGAAEIFEPGTPDPFMLFDHMIRPEWKEKIPAVMHLDGTARLQTITKERNPVAGELLEHYRRLSGIPLLCNTSANFKGSGFFPDVESATRWDQVNAVWSDGTLYQRDEKLEF
jgi:carbamoyltransferase